MHPERWAFALVYPLDEPCATEVESPRYHAGRAVSNEIDPPLPNLFPASQREQKQEGERAIL